MPGYKVLEENFKENESCSHFLFFQVVDLGVYSGFSH